MPQATVDFGLEVKAELVLQVGIEVGADEAEVSPPRR
jgi:hypothetical protein